MLVVDGASDVVTSGGACGQLSQRPANNEVRIIERPRQHQTYKTAQVLTEINGAPFKHPRAPRIRWTGAYMLDWPGHCLETDVNKTFPML